MAVIIAPVRQKKLMLNDMQRRYLDQCVAALDGKDARITITRDVRTRTTKQNRYYWGVVIDMIAGHTGHTPEEVHEAMKMEFLGRRFMSFGGKEIEVSKSTRDQDTLEMTNYIERVRAFAAEFLKLNIPDPVTAGFTVDPETGEILDSKR